MGKTFFLQPTLDGKGQFRLFYEFKTAAGCNKGLYLKCVLKSEGWRCPWFFQDLLTVLNRRCLVGLWPAGFSVHARGLWLFALCRARSTGAAHKSPYTCWKSALRACLAISILLVWMWQWATKVLSQKSPNPVSQVNSMTFEHSAESESVDGARQWDRWSPYN